MYFIGPHVSIGGGVEKAPVNAAAVGATGFGMFTKNQRQWRSPAYAAGSREAFAGRLREHGFMPRQVLPHAGYLINLANPAEEPYARSLGALVDELQRCAAIGLDCLNLHPGSHLRQLDAAAAAARVAGAINEALRRTEGVTVVLENTAGQGACVGATFEELAAIVARVEDRSRIGVCLDTAHAFAAGYDLRDAASWKKTFDDFGRIVGFPLLRGMHLNDSKPGLGSRVDRHESLGKGHLGWEPFKRIVRDARFANLPLVIETPDEDLWPEEVKRLLDAIA